MSPLSPDELLRLFTRQQRIEIDDPDFETDATPELVRLLPRYPGEQGYITYTRLLKRDLERVIAEQIDDFTRRGCGFKWNVFDYDRPAGLRQRLEQRGFQPEEPGTLLALELDAAPPGLLEPLRPEVQRLTHPRQVAGVMEMEAAVWAEDFSALGRRLERGLRLTPDRLSVFAVCVGGLPVSAAWIGYQPGNPWGSLYGGSTLPAYRRQGWYTQLLAARLQEAQVRGVRYLSIDASPMSAPVCIRHGFRRLAEVYPFRWPAPGE